MLHSQSEASRLLDSLSSVASQLQAEHSKLVKAGALVERWASVKGRLAPPCNIINLAAAGMETAMQVWQRRCRCRQLGGCCALLPLPCRGACLPFLHAWPAPSVTPARLR